MDKCNVLIRRMRSSLSDLRKVPVLSPPVLSPPVLSPPDLSLPVLSPPD